MRQPGWWAAIIGFWLLASLRMAADVLAHAELVRAQPAPGETLTQSPAEVRLSFTEPVGPRSNILLFGEQFQLVAGVVAQLDTQTLGGLYARLPALPPGLYTVQWTAVSPDGHQISGSYSFRVVEAVAFEVGTAVDPWALIILLLLASLVTWGIVRRHRAAHNLAK